VSPKDPQNTPRQGAPAEETAAAHDARELRRLTSVMRLLDTVEESPLALSICREAVHLTGADYALLFLCRRGQGSLSLMGTTLPDDHAVRRGLAASVADGEDSPLTRREAGPLRGEDVSRVFSGSPPPGFTPGSVATVPLVGEGLRGVLVVGREPGAGDLGARPLREAAAFVRAVLPHVRNVQLMGRYRDLMIRDDQTRSFNRRYFESFLEEEFIRASRYRSRLSLIFIDLDNLKRVNEEHGHSMGSLAIRRVADRVMPLIRTVDKLFRYGGDEFCVVLPETDWQGALEVAERLRAAICSEPFLRAHVGGVELTASFGVASYPDHATSKEELVRAADEAMYRIKQAGKNSISVAGEAVPGECCPSIGGGI
jgi:diguanylate cyclase (GGDEF)-like protein